MYPMPNEMAEEEDEDVKQMKALPFVLAFANPAVTMSQAELESDMEGPEAAGGHDSGHDSVQLVCIAQPA